MNRSVQGLRHRWASQGRCVQERAGGTSTGERQSFGFVCLLSLHKILQVFPKGWDSSASFGILVFPSIAFSPQFSVPRIAFLGKWGMVAFHLVMPSHGDRLRGEHGVGAASFPCIAWRSAPPVLRTGASGKQRLVPSGIAAVCHYQGQSPFPCWLNGKLFKRERVTWLLFSVKMPEITLTSE